MALTAREATKGRIRDVYLVMLLPIGVAILLTQSRGGMLAAGVVLLLWIVRSLKKVPALVGIAVALVCVFQLSPGAPAPPGC